LLKNPKLAGRTITKKLISVVVICLLLVATASTFSNYSEVKNGKVNVGTINYTTSAQGAENQKNIVLSSVSSMSDIGTTKLTSGDVTLKDENKDIVSNEIRKKTSTSKVEYKTVVRETDKLPEGKTRVARKGEEGLRQKTDRVFYKAGKKVNSITVENKIVKKPVAKIVEKGVANMLSTADGSFKYKTKYTVKATAYSDHTGIPTASGIPCGVGVIAVDPKLIPLGTKCYVKGLNGVKDYGYCIAGDTGGLIKGYKIDLFFNTASEVYNWGIRDVEIYILN